MTAGEYNFLNCFLSVFLFLANLKKLIEFYWMNNYCIYYLHEYDAFNAIYRILYAYL